MEWQEIVERARILLIDDEMANVRLLERLLERAGYRSVHGTTDAREALELFRHVQPDLIVLDLHMPDVGGLDLLEAIQRELPPDTYLPILVLTADLGDAARLRALLGGAKDFLTKPVDGVEIMLRIRILLETRFLFRRLAQGRPTAVPA